MNLDQLITKSNWSLIEFLCALLENVSKVLRGLEGEKRPTANLIMPMVVKLQENWQSLGSTNKNHFKALIEFSIVHLNNRLPLNDLKSTNNWMLIACWCDPRFSDFEFLGIEASVKERYITYCQKVAREWIYEEKKKSATVEEKSDSEDYLFGERSGDDDETYVHEFGCPKDFLFDVLAFWRSHHATVSKTIRISIFEHSSFLSFV